MNKIWIIAKKDIGEAFRSRSTYIFILVMFILTFSFVSSYNTQVNQLTGKQTIIDFSRSFLNSLAYILPVMYSIVVCSIFANYSVVVDKAKRNIESLMATPVSINQIWLGKSLAVTLPSMIIGLTVAIVGYLVINIGFVVPKAGSFIFPDILAIISAIIIVPVLLFTIVTIVIYIQLIISNPRIANFVFTGIFLLLLFGMNAMGGLGISISYFALAYLGAIILFAGVSFILSRSLTKEKVLLSSKM
jgi:ABC-2 type transport system permease protein